MPASTSTTSRKYIISYDLIAPGKNYQPLYDALQAAGAKRVLLSQWAVKINQTAEQLRDAIRAYMDANDRLLVDELSDSNWASWNALIDLNKI